MSVGDSLGSILSAEQFRLTLNGKIFSVIDLSSARHGLTHPGSAGLSSFSGGHPDRGHAQPCGRKTRRDGKRRHLGAETVGCEFEKLSDETQARFGPVLGSAAAWGGAQAHSVFRRRNTLVSRAFRHGFAFRRGADGQYHRMTLYVLGSFIQWTEGGGLSTGRAGPSGEHSELRGALRFETLWLDADPNPTPASSQLQKRSS